MKYKYNGQWYDLTLPAFDSLPIGVIIGWTTNNAPDNYLICDGSAISRTTYSELFNVIGTTYGTGDGSTTFNLPNIKGRVLVGLDSTQTEFDTLGENGGEKTHTLLESEMPSHTHSTYSGGGSSGYPYRIPQIDGINSENSSFCTTMPAGGGQAHNNLQPYIVVNYIIKAKDTTPVMASITDSYSTSTQDGYSCNYVNTELNKKQKLVNYSTSETDTGIKWTDNRPVYRKVINTTSPSSANSWAQIATISNLRDIIKLEGWVYASNERILPIQFSEPNAEIATTVLYDGIEMKVMLSNWCNASCMMIAEYTKTTD